MAMPATSRGWTAEMARALPEDGKRYEVIDGELFVTPAPVFDHQEAVGLLFLRLYPYMRGLGIGHATLSPADIEMSAGTIVQPDLFVVPSVEGKRPRNWSDIRELLLAAEVLSPGSARADRIVKRRFYQRCRVAEYWIVDVSARLIERWRPDDERPEILASWLSWRPESATEALEIDLVAYFAEVFGEPASSPP